MGRTKVAVAMSGGVDSSVTAALMVEKYGKDNVFGITMRLFCYAEAEADEKSCCSLDAVNDAKKVCDQLGINHYAVNLEEEFEEAVVLDFVSEYQKGRTPIPCVPCNTLIKFDYLLKKVESLGADLIATGHYVRIKESEGKYKLLKGKDRTKDQSYFLYGLGQEQLSKTLFPLGDMEKKDVRKQAAKLNLKTAEKPESQGICFVTKGTAADFVANKIKPVPGKIVDTKGNEIGSHEGIIYYTIGQRKRIGGGFEEPMYVVGIEPKKNEVIIGNKEELFDSDVKYSNANWILGEPPVFPKRCTAKIRYNMDESVCELNQSAALFKEPQRAVTPGQSIVFYDGVEVLGGGIID